MELYKDGVFGTAISTVRVRNKKQKWGFKIMNFYQNVIQFSLFLSLSWSTAFAMEGSSSP
jgi:hypothetical protein